MYQNSNKIGLLVVIVMLIATLVACGSSTTEQLQQAADTASTNSDSQAPEVSDEQSVEESQPEPTQPTEPTSKPTESLPTATSEPTSTPEPTEPPPTSTPEPEPVSVMAQGFGQDGRSVGFSFIVENPNSDLAFEDSQYQIAAFDEAGGIVSTDSGYITLLLPEQKLGIGGDLFVEEGVIVSSIDVQLNAGDVEVTEPIPNFSTSGQTYFGRDYFSSATGILESPYSQDVTDLRVSAVVYNENDEIIGGGFTFVNFLLAESSTGADVSVTSAGDVSRVELYPVLSGLSFITEPEDVPADAESISLENFGFGQDGKSVGYAIIVENPNPAYSVENSQYRITFFAEDGTVLDTDEGYINTILPTQTIGIGSETYLDENQLVDRVEAQIKVGKYIEVEGEIPQFTSENATFMPGSYSSKVTGFVVSPYTNDLTDLRISAVAYDVNGEIIGGGFTFLDFASANSKTPVEVSVTTSGTPASVEIFAVPSSMTEFN